ncbi:hypothetical protein CEP54_012339 [Fusarium duplospermum]|uniref:Uncharacterized protein n=1 Tax=Fusarium duplospermum TaxID=1325734 RepID=A0A428P989_9HYPO|nr:hypothetical protein CEP54_012339 [Fusarium duplospermum]
MPFDFKAYDEKCRGLTLEELQREWEHYTRLISGAATSTAVSGMAIPLTLGVSTIGVAMAAPAIHNARKKREIIERHLNRHQATHHTRKRDVLGSMAVSGTIGVVTLGVGSMGADAVATAGAEHGIQSIVANETAIKIATHAALDGAGMAIEHKHTDRLKKKDAFKAFKKAGVFQAVQDAKAAEAGYSIQPYNQQGYPYAAAGSSSQAPPIPPPPPYTPADGQTPAPPSYALTANGYPQDFKAPVAHTSVPQGQQYMTPDATGQQPTPQYYGYPPQQGIPQQHVPYQQQVPGQQPYQQPVTYQQQVPGQQAPQQQVFSPQQVPVQQQAIPQQQVQQVASPQQAPPQQQVPPPGHSSAPSISAQVLSPPQTPAVGYPPQVGQTQQNIQSPAVSQPQSHEQPGYFPQTTANPPSNPAPSSQVYDMSGIKGALPAQTPAPTGSSYQPPPPQQYSVAPLPTPAQEQPQTYTYAQTPQPAVTGYPPPISLPLQPTPQPASAQVASVSAPPPPTPQPVSTVQVPPVSHPPQPTPQAAHQALPVEYQQPAAPATQPQYYPQATYQHTGTYQQAQVPPPPPQDPNRRASMISTPQQPLAPHPTYNPQHYQPASHQQAYTHSAYPSVHTPAPPQQAPAPYQAAQYQAPPPPPAAPQYQLSANYSVPGQPQEQYKPGAQWQNGRPAHQPQHSQQYYYPPTPVSLPTSPPVAQ